MNQSTLPDELPDGLATLWYLIRRVAGLMDRQGEALFRRELGISLAQFLVLSVVDARPGPLSQQAVADRVGLTRHREPPDRQRRGSRPDDRAGGRRTRPRAAVALTEAGIALVRRGDALTQISRAAMWDAIDPRNSQLRYTSCAACCKRSTHDPGLPAPLTQSLSSRSFASLSRATPQASASRPAPARTSSPSSVQAPVITLRCQNRSHASFLGMPRIRTSSLFYMALGRARLLAKSAASALLSP